MKHLGDELDYFFPSRSPNVKEEDGVFGVEGQLFNKHLECVLLYLSQSMQRNATQSETNLAGHVDSTESRLPSANTKNHHSYRALVSR